jgi:hypothetical protein
MQRWPLFLSALVVTSGLGIACGSSTSSQDGDGGKSPSPDGGHKSDAAHEPDAERDGAKRDVVEAGSDAGSDSSLEDAGGDADHDAGPKCAATPTLLLSTASLTSEDAPDSSVPYGVSAPGLAVAGDFIYYVNDYLLGCELPPPSLEAGPPPIPDGGCGGWTGSLWRVPVRGGKPSQVVPVMGEINQRFLAIDDFVVFAASTETGKDPTGTSYVFKVPQKGGPLVKLASTTGLSSFLATDGTNIYFNDADGTKSVPLAGGSTTTITSVSAFSFAPVGSNLILADFTNDAIESVPLTGGPPTTLATKQLAPVYPVACGSDVCWINAGNIGGEDGGLPPLQGELQQLASGSVTTLAIGSSLFEPFGLAFDGTDFFAVSGSGAGAEGQLTRIPADGGAAVVVATFSPGTNGLAIDDECVYWADALGGLYSLAKSATGPFSVE